MSSSPVPTNEFTNPPGDTFIVSDSELPIGLAKEKNTITSKPNDRFWAFPCADNDQSVYIVIAVGTKLPISGACAIKVSVGSIRILEYLVTPNDETLDVVAPLCSNQYILQAETGVSEKDIRASYSNLFTGITVNQSTMFSVFTLSRLASSTNAILEVERSFSFMESRKIFPSAASVIGSSLNSNATQLILERTGAIVGCSDRPSVEFWPELQHSFSSIVQHSMAHDLETSTVLHKPFVVMVCGEKNAGKSTTCRAVINSLLNMKEFRDKGVGFFECDVGQTEFTPCSVVSWSLVKRPLLEPPFMHMKVAKDQQCDSEDINFFASFYGDLSPGQSPNRYFECLQAVHSRIPKALQSQVPLVVNTMGWMKSLGLALLVDTYRLVQPDVVLHLRSAQDTSPHLDQAFFFSADGINTANPPGKKIPQHELLEVAIQRRHLPPNIAANSAQPPPFFLRCLSTVGHLALSKAVASTASLKNMPHCDIPLANEAGKRYIFAGICHERVPATETSRALLGSLVALCNVDVRMPNGAAPPQFLLTLPSGWIGNEFLGLGFVLAVDDAQRKITVATPLAEHPEVLARVNCILRGSVTLSDSAFAEIIPAHLRQNMAPAALQAANAATVGTTDREEGIHSDAQRFAGRQDFMRRKRGIQFHSGNGSGSRQSPNY